MENKPTDQSVTIYVNNDELEQLICAYKEDKKAEAFNRVINKLVACRILVPANVDPNVKKPMPCMLRAGENDMFLPVYTSLKHVPKEPKSAAILNMPYLSANGLVLSAKENIKGIVINPFTENIILKPELLRKIAEVEELKRKGAQPVKMSGDQYMVFERVNFEKQFLPKRLFEEGQALFDRLQERKEAVIDELFEESYQQKRMYPYLEEDFSVMLLAISQELTVARIEFPTKDVAAGVAYRGFLCWNKKEEAGRYFLIERGKEPKSRILAEITKELKIVSYGEAPVDGMELQRVLDLVKYQPGLTS